MSKIKRILSIVFVLAIMASVCIIPASAAVKDEEVAQPYATYCGECGGKVVTITTWENDWYVTNHQAKCTHYPYGYDRIYTRYGSKKQKCQSCGILQGDPVQVTQTKRECHGYN